MPQVRGIPSVRGRSTFKQTRIFRPVKEPEQRHQGLRLRGRVSLE